LTLLAPDIVEAILCGRQPVELQLEGLMNSFPVIWRDQWDALVGAGIRTRSTATRISTTRLQFENGIRRTWKRQNERLLS
jgi:hypothetical protein